MIHTNETLAKLSEHEINILVAEIKCQSYTVRRCNLSGFKWLDKEQDETLDYCQNPEDIMPIAFENKISILSVFDEWMGTVGHFARPRFKLFNKNPLRAICEVFILMNQGDV